jgi:transposase
MPRRRAVGYSPEFRQQMVDLVRTGRSPEDLAREFEPSARAIRNWVVASRDEGHRDGGLTTTEREELHRLRRENRQLREEREIIKKAMAWFAQESVSTRRKPSGS